MILLKVFKFPVALATFKQLTHSDGCTGVGKQTPLSSRFSVLSAQHIVQAWAFIASDCRVKSTVL